MHFPLLTVASTRHSPQGLSTSRRRRRNKPSWLWSPLLRLFLLFLALLLAAPAQLRAAVTLRDLLALIQSPLSSVPAPRPHAQVLLGTIPLSASHGPHLRLILMCPRTAPCCTAQLSVALRAALHQTLLPNDITILHGCPRHSATALHQQSSNIVLEVIPNRKPSNQEESPVVEIHSCPTHRADVEICLLRLLALRARGPGPSTHTLVTTAATILEPSAAESLWLFALLRNVSAARPQAFPRASGNIGEESLAEQPSDPSPDDPPSVLPLLFSTDTFHAHENASVVELWKALSDVLASSRMLRVALFSLRGDNVAAPTLALRREVLSHLQLQPWLWSERAFYRWSARRELQENYALKLDTVIEREAFDVSALPFRPVRAHEDGSGHPHVFLMMPWMQMGGSEKCVLDVAERLVEMRWPVTFVFTMPFWKVDGVGEISLRNDWLGRARGITSDVFDLVAIAPNDKFSRLLRYLLESRRPDFIFMTNSRPVYEHTKFIKSVLPSVMIADYNHMVHMTWKAAPGKYGGMPRYAAENSKYMDLHLTASRNVTTAIQQWMPEDELSARPEKVQTCYIGTDPTQLHNGSMREDARRRMRRNLRIGKGKIVVLFAGRFVADKGIDTMSLVLKSLAKSTMFSSRFSFVFVGTGEERGLIESTMDNVKESGLQALLRPPAAGLQEMRDYYAMADILLLPSTKEGIALVLYEAMAAGLLVMSTDVGGQKELIKSSTGILLPGHFHPQRLADHIRDTLREYLMWPQRFQSIQEKGTNEVLRKFTTVQFCDCVINNMKRAKSELGKMNRQRLANRVDSVRLQMAESLRWERVHGMWARRQAIRDLETVITVGVWTTVSSASIAHCVRKLVQSTRSKHPSLRILIANDGRIPLGKFPFVNRDKYTQEVRLDVDMGKGTGYNLMLNLTETEYFLKLNDFHHFDKDTNLDILLRGIANYDFDMIGMQVRQLACDANSVNDHFVPKVVARMISTGNGMTRICVLNEDEYPELKMMHVPVQADLFHEAWMARTDILQKLQPSHIADSSFAFFMRMRSANVRMGYLPSAFVNRCIRMDAGTISYEHFQERKWSGQEEINTGLLKDDRCSRKFVRIIQQHIKHAKEIV